MTAATVSSTSRPSGPAGRVMRRSTAWQRIIGRLVQAVTVVWAAYTVTFVVLYLVPGDPVEMMVNGGGGGNGSMVGPDLIEELRSQYGFDRPVPVQYGMLLWRALGGDLGTSMQTGATVWDTIWRAFPETLRLAGLAMMLTVIAGLMLALASAASRGWLRTALLSLPAIGVSVPVFWVGFVLIDQFAFRTGAFPAVGNTGFASLVLPAVTLAVPNAAHLAQVLSRNLQDLQGEAFVTVVRAKGVGELAILWRHVLRNGCLPVLTMAAMMVGAMLAGSVVVETVFSRDGIGQVLAAAVRTKDIPVVQGLVILAAIVFVVVNLVVDMLYPVLDARVRVDGRVS